jgi:predicted NUDIX family NTP pyrophosphohydrolase
MPAKHAKHSAGILLFRSSTDAWQVLIGHLGGPLWARREDAAWSIPKGEIEPDEDPGAAASREFTEELGLPVPDGAWLELGEVRQSGGKVVTCWAIEADLDPSTVTLGTFEMQWPPRSGKTQLFPELDRVEWCDLALARTRLVRAQQDFLDRLPPLSP